MSVSPSSAAVLPATLSTLPDTVTLRDVSLRDGLQDEAPIPTETKLALFDVLVAAGVRELELTSFVRPDRVPALADAEALCAATSDDQATRWGLVLNERGARRALDAGLTHLQFVVSVSDTHSRENAGAAADDAFASLLEVAGPALDAGATVEMTLATAFGCPFERRVDPARVVSFARRAAAAGITSIGLADTIGVATPNEVAALVSAVVAATSATSEAVASDDDDRAGGVHAPGRPVTVGAHLHDTRGLAVANGLAALQSGATRLDAAVGGLGGCPFAPGASGNVAIEDLAHALGEMGVDTGLSVDGLVDAARLACEATGRTVVSHVGVAGPRFA